MLIADEQNPARNKVGSEKGVSSIETKSRVRVSSQWCTIYIYPLAELTESLVRFDYIVVHSIPPHAALVSFKTRRSII
jgi:hypothetical protein